jgi:hypothetical protein
VTIALAILKHYPDLNDAQKPRILCDRVDYRPYNRSAIDHFDGNIENYRQTGVGSKG